jgi:hypothetical protein
LSPDFVFVSRIRQQIFVVSRTSYCQQILSANFCRQQICFLSENVFADVMEMTLTPAYAVSRQPVSSRKSFRLRPARIFASITIPFVLPDLPVQVPGTTYRRNDVQSTST